MNLKLARRLLRLWGTLIHVDFVFMCRFRFRVKTLYDRQTDRQTDGQTDRKARPVMRTIRTAAHGKSLIDDTQEFGVSLFGNC